MPPIDPKTGIFIGYASLFNMPDSANDMVLPGAFARSLKERGARGIRMLWQHDPAAPVGTWLAMSEDRHGLKVTGRLCLASAKGQEIAALVQAGAVDGLSIGFQARRAANQRGQGLRRLMDVDLWEVSIVTFPALVAARIGALPRVSAA